MSSADFTLRRTACVRDGLCAAKLLQAPDGYVVRGDLMLGPSREHYRRIPNRSPLHVSRMKL